MRCRQNNASHLPTVHNDPGLLATTTGHPADEKIASSSPRPAEERGAATKDSIFCPKGEETTSTTPLLMISRGREWSMARLPVQHPAGRSMPRRDMRYLDGRPAGQALRRRWVGPFLRGGPVRRPAQEAALDVRRTDVAGGGGRGPRPGQEIITSHSSFPGGLRALSWEWTRSEKAVVVVGGWC